MHENALPTLRGGLGVTLGIAVQDHVLTVTETPKHASILSWSSWAETAIERDVDVDEGMVSDVLGSAGGDDGPVASPDVYAS